MSLYRISFKAFEEGKRRRGGREKGRALEEGALGDSEQGQEGKEGRPKGDGALLTKLFLHFGRWMGLTGEENRRKECFQECRGDYKGFAFPLFARWV